MDEAIRPNHIVLTTAPGVDGFRVARTLDVVIGGGAFEERLFRDILPGARVTCLQELRNEAAQLGTDAVIAVNIDISVSPSGNWVVVGTGTAVQLERLPDIAPSA
ncbi:MAG: heavy metal-binding domain-containing protein [Gemmatimonadaceae bacterium]